MEMLEYWRQISMDMRNSSMNHFPPIYYINPQFRSIIPCEVLLYIEVTFLGFIH